MTVRPGELIIGDHNWAQHAADPVVDGERKARGLVPRNFATHPPGYYARGEAFDMPLIPRGEWPERIRDLENSGSRLSDIRMAGKDGGPMPSTDQNGRGYCWMHSGTSALLLVRARDNQPYVDLSAYGPACLIKNYKDEGGWGCAGLDWLCENGCPSSEFWPQRSVSRSNDTPEMRANARLHRACETWMEAGAPYDRNLTFDQTVTCVLCRIPVVVDYGWWGHSVCAVDAVDGSKQRKQTRTESGKLATVKEFELIWGMNTSVTGFSIRIWNSWGQSWGSEGMGVLTGGKAPPDGAGALRAGTASVV